MHSWIRQDGEESDTDASFDERLTDDIPSTCGGRRPVRAKSNASKCTQSPFITPAKQERQTLQQVQNLSIPGSFMSEDQSLLRHRQNIQRIQQRPPFLGKNENGQSGAGPSADRGAASFVQTHQDAYSTIPKEFLTQLEDLKRENVAVKDENVAMRERLYHLERQVNQNRRQNDVWQFDRMVNTEAQRSYDRFVQDQMIQHRAAAININRFNHANYNSEQLMFTQHSKSNGTTFQMSFGRSSTSIQKQEDPNEERFKKVEQKVDKIDEMLSYIISQMNNKSDGSAGTSTMGKKSESNQNAFKK
uniref:Uncharacterized protein n=1 Tax=Meloidogyne enterolobii TaxID=390850 RepID=A0A6V7VY46_MELEN|nr:unnamed protein product [Meloidogyne enterolobii]